MINMKNVVNYILLAAILFSSCTLVEDIRLDCHNITVNSGPQELTFNVSGDRLDMIFIGLFVNDLLVGSNDSMVGVIDGYYEYSVLWSRVKYDVNDGRSLKVYLDENDSEQPRTICIRITDAHIGAEMLTITQKSGASE